MKALLKAISIPLFLGIAALSCSDKGSPLPAIDPYQRWKALDLHDYTVDQVMTCFCATGGQRMRVTVRSDTIQSVVRITDGASVPPPSSTYYFTVEALFDRIRNNSGDSLVVRYHNSLGYPEFLDINPQLHPVDGGVLYETSNLRSL